MRTVIDSTSFTSIGAANATVQVEYRLPEGPISRRGSGAREGIAPQFGTKGSSRLAGD